MARYQGILPRFSENSCGANIELETGLASAKWNFCKSQGLAFSGFCLHDNRVFEAIFKGSGHARIGLTQTDPDHITDLQEAIRRNQILFVSDVRFHKRECVVGIVKSVQGNSCKFETRFQENEPQIKDLVAGSDVWIVFFLKFGEYGVQLRDKVRQNILKFHRKRDTNVFITNDLLSMRLLYPFPFAYACVGNTIDKGHSIKFSVTPKEEDGKKPKQFHFRVGVSSRRAPSAEALDFAPLVSEKLEKDECLGEFTVCVSPAGKLHLHRKDCCIDSRTISDSVNVDLPLYVCFEIFRVRVQLLETQHCNHKSEAVENCEPIANDEYEEFPYANMVEVQGVMRHILRVGKITEDDKSKIRSITPGLTEYVHHSSVSRGVEREGYLTPVNSSEMRNILQMMEDIKADNAEKNENLTQLIEKLLTVVEKLLKNHKPTAIILTSGQFREHLQNTCADFIQNVDTFPLCDHLLQYGIISQAQYEKLRDEFRRCRQDANRDLFSILTKKEYCGDQLLSIQKAFDKTKQEHLLPKYPKERH